MMIFRQWRAILEVKKTQTRRMAAFVDGDMWRGTVPSQYKVGKDYAVVPKRGQRDIWWACTPVMWRAYTGVCYEARFSKNVIAGGVSQQYLEQQGYRQLRIRICHIRHERLQAITEQDARAEGVESVNAYRDLWQSINGKTKFARWEDNPLVWVISFEVVK